MFHIGNAQHAMIVINQGFKSIVAVWRGEGLPTAHFNLYKANVWIHYCFKFHDDNTTMSAEVGYD